MSKIKQAEYLWVDGAKPVQKIRSKTRITIFKDPDNVKLSDFPEWSFDGSSTNQSQGGNSDLLLRPVNFVKDPIRGEGNYLVLCEVENPDGTPHWSNTRAGLRRVLDAGGAKHNPWVGFEQEYTLYRDGIPLGWPTRGFPAPQGPYYCGVGNDSVYGRQLVEEHTEVCIEAGILIYGTNAEVMPGQWEFQIGYRGNEDEDNSVINVCDHLWFARWLIYRLGEDYDIDASISNKPMKGDWNGAGMHTNFSINEFRNPVTGREAISKAIDNLGKKHREHIAVYGHGLDQRLTGDHETCGIDEFKAGVADRGCSIRIPRQVDIDGCGYLEDRRPGANACPYQVSEKLVSTILEID